MNRQYKGAFTALATACAIFAGLGCGTGDETLGPVVKSSSSSSGSGLRQQAVPSAAAGSFGDDASPVPVKDAIDLLKEKAAKDYLQELQTADPADREDLLADGLYSPDPTIQLMALNDVEPMLAWNDQARTDVEGLLQYTTDPGMRMRIEDLLSKEVSPVLQPTSAYAGPH